MGRMLAAWLTWVLLCVGCSAPSPAPGSTELNLRQVRSAIGSAPATVPLILRLTRMFLADPVPQLVGDVTLGAGQTQFKIVRDAMGPCNPVNCDPYNVPASVGSFSDTVPLSDSLNFAINVNGDESVRVLGSVNLFTGAYVPRNNETYGPAPHDPLPNEICQSDFFFHPMGPSKRWTVCWTIEGLCSAGSCSDGTKLSCAGDPCTTGPSSNPACSGIPGTVSCSSGFSCSPLPLPVPDNTCNGIDDNCNGQVDEDFVKKPEICNGLDDDCNGQIDEGLAGVPETCNGVDDNCNGQIDEGFASVPETINGIDDNCNGQIDEGSPLPCAPGQTDWWCCPTGADVHFPVASFVDDAPEDAALQGCLPVGLGSGTACNLRGVVRRAEQLAAVAGVRPLCRVVADLAPGTHVLSRPAVENSTTSVSKLVLSNGDLTLHGTGGTPGSTIIEPPTDDVVSGRLIRMVSPPRQVPPALTIQNVLVRRGNPQDFFEQGGGAILFIRRDGEFPVGAASLTIEDSIFERNHAAQEGGAVQFWDATVMGSTLTVRRSLFRHNQAEAFANDLGGAVSARNVSVTLEDSALVYNKAGRGGGLFVQNGSLLAVNNTFSGNTCLFAGCGVNLESVGGVVDATLRFNTITNNQMTPPEVGPGLHVTSGVRLRAAGNVIAGNNPLFIASGAGSPDCSIGDAPLALGRNLIGIGGLDCSPLGAPSPGIIGSTTARLDAGLALLPETPPPGRFFANVCAAGFDPGVTLPPCDLACKPAQNAAECLHVLESTPPSPASNGYTAPFGAGDPTLDCPIGDQRQFLRPRTPSTINCSLGSYESSGVADPDGDGLPEQLDVQPGQFSNDFSDALLFGRTSGRILDRAGQTLFVRDAVGLQDGVEIGVLSSSLSGVVRISGCNDTVQLSLAQGQVTSLNCPATHSRVFSQFGFVLGNQADLFGDVFANQFNFGSDVHVEGNLMSNASGSLGTGSVIRGNATLTGALGGNRSGVLGRLLEHTSVASQSIFVQPGASLSAVSEAIHNSAPGADAVLPPGDYGDVTIDAGATVQMGPGLYRLHSLTAATDVTLETFANGNATAILVDGQLTLGDRFRTRAASGGVDAKVNIALYTNGTAIQLGHDQFLLGSIESPFGQLVLGNNAFIRDGLSASVLNVGHDATIGSGESTACASSALTPVAATSSSSESATLGPSKAIDGNVATRWSSAASDPQWIALDLGVTRLINRVVLNWEAAFSRSYAIQVAPSASGPWSTIYKTTTGDGGIDDLKGLQGTGRFVRMFSTARGTQFGNSLFEFQVFGDANAACAGFVQLVPTAAVSSSNESSSLTGANAIDADANTRWSSAFSDNQWLYVDLGATRTIKRVVLDWQAAFSSQYDIQVSNAPSVGWTTVYTNNAGDGGVDDLSGLSGQGRYVRMLGRKRATSFGHSLWELQVYGVP